MKIEYMQKSTVARPARAEESTPRLKENCSLPMPVSVVASGAIWSVVASSTGQSVNRSLPCSVEGTQAVMSATVVLSYSELSALKNGQAGRQNEFSSYQKRAT